MKLVTVQLNPFIQNCSYSQNFFSHWKSRFNEFHRCTHFSTKFRETLDINLKPFFDRLHENNQWNWTEEHERHFQILKSSPTSETELSIPNTKRPLFT